MGFGAASLLLYLMATVGAPGDEEVVDEPLLLLILLLLVSTGAVVVVVVVFYYYSRYFRALSTGEMHRACTLLRYSMLSEKSVLRDYYGSGVMSVGVVVRHSIFNELLSLFILK